MNVYLVRDFLGHASVTTTQVYLKGNRAKMRKTIEAAADATIMPNASYYTDDKKAELLAFLNTLI